MKIAVLNDTHTGIRNSSEIFLKNAQDFYENIFFPECDKHDIKQIVHLGDYYDHRKFVNFRALNHNRKHFLNELRNRGMSMDIIPGNHDTFYKNTNESNTSARMYVSGSTNANGTIQIRSENSGKRVDGMAFFPINNVNHIIKGEDITYSNGSIRTNKIIYNNGELPTGTDSPYIQSNSSSGRNDLGFNNVRVTIWPGSRGQNV